MKTINNVALTIEEIDAQGDFKNLLQAQKLRLIALIYDLSLALYNIFGKNDE